MYEEGSIYVVFFPDGTLLVMGGYNNGGSHDTVWQFDINNGTVTQIADAPAMPLQSWYTGSAQKLNTVYILGGKTSTGNKQYDKKVMRFQLGRWKELASLSEDRNSACPFILGDKLYIAGGTSSTVIETLDLTNVNAKWANTSFNLPFVMDKPASATINDTVFLTYNYTLLKYDLNKSFWAIYIIRLSVKRIEHCMVSDDHSHLWVLGGQGTLSVEMYDLLTGLWTEKSPIPHYQHILTAHGCVYHDGFIYVVGGFGSNFYSHKIYIYSVEHDTWTNFSLPAGLAYMSVGLLSWG